MFDFSILSGLLSETTDLTERIKAAVGQVPQRDPADPLPTVVYEQILTALGQVDAASYLGSKETPVTRARDLAQAALEAAKARHPEIGLAEAMAGNEKSDLLREILAPVQQQIDLLALLEQVVAAARDDDYDYAEYRAKVGGW